MSGIGGMENPLRVAVVGAGPAGFYAAGELLRQEALKVTVDMYDRLPTPFGLVRGGVAPDHQKIKTVTKVYEKTAANPAFRFMGNVTIGRDITVEDLLAHYHQVIVCTGAQSDRRLGIPGEDLSGSHPATEFVAWYNGHPDYQDHRFNLNVEAVAVIGNGNVAMDVVRMLMAQPEELAATDVTQQALAALRASQVKQVYVLGRRGPAQAAFTNPEIRELTELDGVDLVLRPEELNLDAVSQAQLAASTDPTNQRNLDILGAHAQKPLGGQPRQIHLRFLVSPVEIQGEGKVERLLIETNRLEDDGRGGAKAVGTGRRETLKVGAVFRSIGYKGVAIPGLPFDERAGVIPNQAGRVMDQTGKAQLPRFYTAGWIKRGPSGVVGTNKACAVETVTHMLEDAKTLNVQVEQDPKAVLDWLDKKGVKVVSYADWQKLDGEEVARGKALGKPREKFTRVSDMLNMLGKQ